MQNITYCLLPCTVAKGRTLSDLAGACRYVWNEMLAQQEAHIPPRPEGRGLLRELE